MAADTVEPSSQRIGHPDVGRPLDQDQEGRLKRVVGILGVGEHAAADAEHHRSVPLDEDRKRQFPRLVAAGTEQLQKLPVAQRPDCPCAEQGPDPVRDCRGAPPHRLHPLC
jgi:hypothetical protein